MLLKNNKIYSADSFIVCPSCEGALDISEDKSSCANCSSVYIKKSGTHIFSHTPVLHDESVTSEKQKKDKNLWTTWRSRNYRFFEQHLTPFVGELAVCDIGAGPVQFEDLFLRFSHYVGVDFYPYSNVSVVADLESRLPLRSQSFDIVIMSNVAEHLYSPKAVFVEMFRITKRGGTLIGTVPYLINVHQAPHDYFRYTHFALERMLKESGYDKVQIIPLGTIVDSVYDVWRIGMSEMESHMRIKESLLARIVFRVFRKIGSVYFRAMGYLRSPETLVFPKGYGFVATKI